MAMACAAPRLRWLVLAAALALPRTIFAFVLPPQAGTIATTTASRHLRQHHHQQRQQQHRSGCACGRCSGGRRGGVAMAASGSLDLSAIHIMMNGLPGNMGREVAAACLRKGFSMAPYALTGPDIDGADVAVDDMAGGAAVTVKLLKAGQPGTEEKIRGMQEQLGSSNLIVIDYTHPTAVNGNAELYGKLGLPFVMGTTGGDRDKLIRDTEGSGVYAVIAPNMGKQIVALQTAIDYMAREFPASFGGYKLTITESHQSTKADTSGTAKALAQDFAALTGAPYDMEEINMIRDAPGQKAFGVPDEYLRGHAFHTYSLVSADGTTEFQFRHNVCGRRMYAEGTADAVEFLARQIASGTSKRLYNMIDVLKMGGI